VFQVDALTELRRNTILIWETVIEATAKNFVLGIF